VRALLLIGAVVAVAWLFHSGRRQAGFAALGATLMMVVFWQYESTRFAMTHGDCVRWEYVYDPSIEDDRRVCAHYPPNGEDPSPVRVLLNTPIHFLIGRTPL
jgi:hypothetical protein